MLPVYAQPLDALAAQGVQWVQVDEPILVTDLEASWQQALRQSYQYLQRCPIRILLSSYFDPLLDNKALAVQLPVASLHVDACSDRADTQQLIDLLPADKVLSLGVISGRNIWKSDWHATLDWLEPLAQQTLHLYIALKCRQPWLPSRQPWGNSTAPMSSAPLCKQPTCNCQPTQRQPLARSHKLPKSVARAATSKQATSAIASMKAPYVQKLHAAYVNKKLWVWMTGSGYLRRSVTFG